MLRSLRCTRQAIERRPAPDYERMWQLLNNTLHCK